jgi:hypothetical protein
VACHITPDLKNSTDYQDTASWNNYLLHFMFWPHRVIYRLISKTC